eukprot:1547807-Pyramimonas_sp.AAC.1
MPPWLNTARARHLLTHGRKGKRGGRECSPKIGTEKRRRKSMEFGYVWPAGKPCRLGEGGHGSCADGPRATKGPQDLAPERQIL